MTGQQLKNSILQMAVQGKLVPQDPNEEPASVLLERIRKEKEQLIKEGKIKKEKNPSYIFRGADNLPYEKVGKSEPVCIADEVPFDIPDSWEWVRLSSIASVLGGKRIPAGRKLSQNNTGHIYIRVSDMKNNSVKTDSLLYVPQDIYPSISKYIINKEDIYITVAGTIGTVGKIPPELDGANLTENADRLVFRLINQDWLIQYLSSSVVQNQIAEATTKVGQPKLAIKRIEDFLIALPPVVEQHRIVEKIKQIEPYLNDYSNTENELKELNNEFPILLKKSILQEAVRGKLVPQDPTDKPASVLLERIRAEKEQLIKKGKIKRDKHESVIFRRDNSHYEKCGSKEENIDEILPFDLPDSWEWIRLSAILTSTDAGKSPQCENRPRNNCEWGVIKTTAIQDGYFLAEENKVLPLSFNIQESMMVHHGDLLITRAGPRNRTGVICVVDGKPENLILSDKTVRLSYLRDFVNPHYVMTALSSPAMQYFVIDAMTGMAASQVNISQKKMKTFLLPLPPLNEQQRIVDEVGKIFARISKLNF